MLNTAYLFVYFYLLTTLNRFNSDVHTNFPFHLHLYRVMLKAPYLCVDWYLLTTVHFHLYYIQGGYGWKSRGTGIQAVRLPRSAQAEYIAVKASLSVNEWAYQGCNTLRFGRGGGGARQARNSLPR